MDGRGPGRSTRRASLVVALAIAGSAAMIAACNPAPPPISDPREILERAAEHLRAAQRVHLEATADGTIGLGAAVSLPGGGTGSVALAGTRAEGDLDLAADRAAIRFEVPALLGLAGEIRQMGTEAYLSSSLTSRGWHRLGTSALPLGIPNPVAWVDGIAAWLEQPASVPVRLADASCRVGTCYVVRLLVSGRALEPLASEVPALADAMVTVETRIDRTSLELSEATIRVDLGPGGTVEVRLTFSAWNAPVTIGAPPAAEIVEDVLAP